MTFEVHWEPSQNSTYIYGSTIQYLDSGVVSFKNERMPPGTAIVKWLSLPSFQADKGLIQLPLLKRGSVYRFSLALKSIPEHSVLIKVDCFERSGELISTRVVPVAGGDILYPDTAFSYSVELIGTGVKELFFHSLFICEQDKPVEQSNRDHTLKRTTKLETYRSKRRGKHVRSKVD